MSPIFVRPVREQLEHDRLIRHLQLKYKRKFEVAVNMGDEQAAPVKSGTHTVYPDLVLTSGRKIEGVVEVESAESTNNLEAMAEWVPYSRSRLQFHLYVPMHMYESARRLCEAHQVRASEVWGYRPAADGFDLIRMFADSSIRTSGQPVAPKPVAPKPAAPAQPAKPVAAPPVAKPSPKVAKSNGKPSKAIKPSKPSKPSKPVGKPKPAPANSRGRTAAAPKKAPAKSRAKAPAKRKK